MDSWHPTKRQQTDRRPSDHCEPHIQVKSGKVEAHEFNSDIGEPIKWVVYQGGLLKVEKVDHTYRCADITEVSCEIIDKNVHNTDDNVSKI